MPAMGGRMGGPPGGIAGLAAGAPDICIATHTLHTPATARPTTPLKCTRAVEDDVKHDADSGERAC